MIKKVAFTAVAAAVCIAAAVGCSSGKKYSVHGQRLASPNVSERRAAAQELRTAPRNEKIVPIVLQACRDEDADVRMHGFFALGRMDPAVEGVIPVIFEGLADSVTDVRRAAVNALSELNPFPNACFPQMVRMLVDEDEKIRKLITTIFVDLRGAGVGSLIRHIDNENVDLRIAIITTLEAIGPPAKSALPRLKKISSEDLSETVKEAAQNAIKRIE